MPNTQGLEKKNAEYILLFLRLFYLDVYYALTSANLADNNSKFFKVNNSDLL